MSTSISILKDIWTWFQSVWKQGLLGLDVERAAIALAILLAFVVLRSLFTKIILNRMHALASKTSTEFDDLLITALRAPVSYVPLLVGLFIAVEYLALTGKPLQFAETVMRSLSTALLFWALVRAVSPMTLLFDAFRHNYSETIVDWLERSLRMLLIFIGSAAILEMWGVKVGPILAGLGLFGVAVALGAQDLFKNLISGLLIISEGRFRKGHWIKVDGVVEGVVEKVGFRSTKVRRFDQAPVYVPNTNLADKPVTNFSRMTFRRIYWLIALEYTSSVEQLRQVRDDIERYVLDSGDFASPSEISTFVRIDSFNDSSIDIMLYCFTKTTAWGEWLEAKEKLACRIKEVVEKAGTGFAFPSRTIYMAPTAGEDDHPEAFVPPEEDKGE